jgi:hypothetical protein
MLIDGRNGRVVKARILGPGFLHIAIAPIRFFPTGDVSAVAVGTITK